MSEDRIARLIKELDAPCAECSTSTSTLFLDPLTQSLFSRVPVSDERRALIRFHVHTHPISLAFPSRGYRPVVLFRLLLYVNDAVPILHWTPGSTEMEVAFDYLKAALSREAKRLADSKVDKCQLLKEKT